MQVDTNPTERGKEQSSREIHFVYIVKCSNGAFYTGYTTNVEKRLATHNAGKGARYTRSRLPVRLVAFWSFSRRGDALRAIKRLSRAQKMRLVEEGAEAYSNHSRQVLQSHLVSNSSILPNE